MALALAWLFLAFLKRGDDSYCGPDERESETTGNPLWTFVSMGKSRSSKASRLVSCAANEDIRLFIL